MNGSSTPGHPDLDVVKLGQHIGARIDGVRLDAGLDPGTLATVNQALIEHKVIFFRGQQHLDDDTHYAFAASLGVPTTPHPLLGGDASRFLAIDSDDGFKANSWHTDVTFVDRVPKASILRAVDLPTYGGTTMWASTVAAYRHLPEPLRRLAEDLWALHTNMFDYTQFDLDDAAARSRDGRRTDTARLAEDFRAQQFVTKHPVVQVLPDSGERALLLGGFVQRILGVNQSESQMLYRLFQERITVPENTIRWNWQPGDLAIWDNRATQHYAVADYGTQHRRMHRVTLAGGIPVSVAGQRSQAISGDASAYSIVDQIHPAVA